MQLELKHLQQSLGITFVYVTHDQEEALTMSDRIVVMNNGKIEQIDEPRKIYNFPKTLFVANFIGDTNILKGVVTKVEKDFLEMEFGGDSFVVKNDGAFYENEEVHVSIRPENISFTSEESDDVNFEVTIKELIYIGSLTKVVAELADGQEIIIQSTNGTNVEKDTSRYITWKKEDSL